MEQGPYVKIEFKELLIKIKDDMRTTLKLFSDRDDWDMEHHAIADKYIGAITALDAVIDSLDGNSENLMKLIQKVEEIETLE